MRRQLLLRSAFSLDDLLHKLHPPLHRVDELARNRGPPDACRREDHRVHHLPTFAEEGLWLLRSGTRHHPTPVIAFDLGDRLIAEQPPTTPSPTGVGVVEDRLWAGSSSLSKHPPAHDPCGRPRMCRCALVEPTSPGNRASVTARAVEPDRPGMALRQLSSGRLTADGGPACATAGFVGAARWERKHQPDGCRR